MTITQDDLIVRLEEISREFNLDVDDEVMKVLGAPGIPLDVLQFINAYKPLEIVQFYEKLRKSYNEKKSKLYITIVRDDLEKGNLAPEKIRTTLISYLLQASLFAENLDDDRSFLKQTRLKDISAALSTYFTSYDMTDCLVLLRAIQKDLKACEEITERRH